MHLSSPATMVSCNYRGRRHRDVLIVHSLDKVASSVRLPNAKRGNDFMSRCVTGPSVQCVL